MEFDWLDAPFDLKRLPPREIEESFEDPFSIRLLPDLPHAVEARYFNLGKTTGDRALFSVFWTDGKRYRVLLSRPMTPEEANFYERKNAEYHLG
ncbi:MAG: BrnT family toxin [Verrucomicrobia bacterium]|nr:BrnT family toxin [Verrucomicrobiota bacterium]MBV9658505.1 BrnT family toxin [Verrucomicrobiota bacterium]